MTGEELKAIIAERIERDPRLRKIRARISKGRATKADSFTYSRICSEIMSEELAKAVLDLDDREGICAALLRGNYEEIMQTADAIQRSIDEKQGIHMQPRRPAFPAERVQQIAHSLVDPTVPDEKIVRRARSTATVSMSFHDDFVQENAAFRARAGLKCFITRETDGSCCKWCSALAGRYEYGEEPEEVYHRHDNCGCTVTYENGRKRQDVWSKRTWEVPGKDAGAKEPARLTTEQAAAKEAEHLPTVLTNGRIRSIIKAITVDDVITAGKIHPDQPSAISEEVAKKIIDTITTAKNAGGRFTFDEVRAVSIPKKAENGLVVFQTNAVDKADNPHVILEINLDAVGDLDVEHVDLLFAMADNTKCNSLADGIIHEIGHAKTIEGRTYANYERIAEELADVHVDGISDLAKKDGLELIAECEVILAHGGKIPPDIMEIYTTYTTGGG